MIGNARLHLIIRAPAVSTVVKLKPSRWLQSTSHLQHIPHLLFEYSPIFPFQKYPHSFLLSPSQTPLLFPSTSLKHKTALKNHRLRVVVSALKKLLETELVAVSSENDAILRSESGVYAIYNGSGDLQFVGITRNLATSVLAHKKSVPELCCSVKVSNSQSVDTVRFAFLFFTFPRIFVNGELVGGCDILTSMYEKKIQRRQSS
ncbi:hypothetical protein Pfo_004458 [Paulownia fortunei]|nr:hypothetical protein Pfo_004458 [Paulownia fortunei]